MMKYVRDEARNITSPLVILPHIVERPEVPNNVACTAQRPYVGGMALLSFEALHLQSILLRDKTTSLIIEETIRESRDLSTGCGEVERVEKREHSSAKPELLEFAGEQDRNVGLVGRLKVAE